MFTTPILVIIFNRPDFAEKLYLVLNQIRPSTLYVISDGPRTPQEAEEVKKSRNIFEKFAWECQVQYNYSDRNMGLRERISSGISWAFQNENKLIILEDDCIPHPDFFFFCESLLHLYEDDKRIMTINGCNLNPSLSKDWKEPYFFSKYSSSWGWATWKRAWELFDSELNGFIEYRDLDSFSFNLPYSYRSKLYWRFMLDRVQQLKINSWAYRWMFTLWINNGLAIVPRNNMIQNIGNDKRGMNTKGKLKYLNIPVSPMKKREIRKLPHTFPNYIHDKWMENNIFSKSIYQRFLWISKKFFLTISKTWRSTG